jgi:hypothetical protein
MIDYSTSSQHAMFTSLQQNVLSASFTAELGCPQSLPPMNGR